MEVELTSSKSSSDKSLDTDSSKTVSTIQSIKPKRGYKRKATISTKTVEVEQDFKKPSLKRREKKLERKETADTFSQYEDE